MSEIVYIGLGSNEGDREGRLLAAREALSRIDAVACVGCSSLYQTEAVGPKQPPFLNAVVAVQSALEPLKLLGILKQIEIDVGRVPGERWGPRAVDLDLLLWGDRVVALGNLQIPHLEMHRRRFVLEPLLELAPEIVHPVLGRRCAELLSGVGGQKIEPYPSEQWLRGQWSRSEL